MKDTTRKEATSRSQHWWFCENIINHPEQVGLLRMDFPRIFVLIRNRSIGYWADYEKWKRDIAEVHFFTPSERKDADMDALLTEAWNFLALTEEEEDRMYEETHGYEDEE